MCSLIDKKPLTDGQRSLVFVKRNLIRVGAIVREKPLDENCRDKIFISQRPAQFDLDARLNRPIDELLLVESVTELDRGRQRLDNVLMTQTNVRHRTEQSNKPRSSAVRIE